VAAEVRGGLASAITSRTSTPVIVTPGGVGLLRAILAAFSASVSGDLATPRDLAKRITSFGDLPQRTAADIAGASLVNCSATNGRLK
jgi:hypothetical protein